MPVELLIALVAATPPTIAATAAWRRSRKVEEVAEQVNIAVNHRAPGQPTLVQTVDDIAKTLGLLHQALEDSRQDLQAHQAWHQRQEEEK